jgi:D-glycero-alpha-D-manno-heptose-7-phosphate kinase
MIKRELAEGVTTSAVDEIYEAAQCAGAIGGKLLGVGGGGFMALFVDPRRRDAVRDALRGLVEVRFRTGAPGSRVVVYEPNDFDHGWAPPKPSESERPPLELSVA